MHKAKKSLGQNFLKSQAALRAIISAAHITGEDIVLEIGPGKGVLTQKIIPLSLRIIAVEKDESLVANLHEKFSDAITAGKLELLSGDILDFDPETLRVYDPSVYKIVANIPYYLTGAIIRMFLESTYQPQQMVLLVQKEVAERIVSRDGKESILSISVKAYGEPRYIEKVPKKYFSPEPKVDSAIISIENISKKHFKNIEELAFFEVVHAGFAHKRKTLKNNLEMAGFDPVIIEKALQENAISSKERPENIPIAIWFRLYEQLHPSDEEK